MPADNEAIVDVGANNRPLRGDLAKTRKIFEKTFRGIGRRIQTTLKGALSPLGVGVGAFGIAAIGKEVLDFEESLTRIKIQGGDAAGSIDGMRNRMIALSKETGIARNQIAAGEQSLINYLGATETTAERVNVLAKANVATGTSMEDLAGIAFKLDTAFGITSGADLELALDALTDAGKRTSIPLSKMGTLLAKTAPLFKQTGASGVDAANDLGAFLQITQKFGTAATPEEVATQFASFVGSLEKNAGKIRKLSGGKVNVFTTDEEGRKRLKSVGTILTDIGNSKLAKDPNLLIKALGRREAKDFAQAIIENREEFESLRAESAKAGGTIKRDFKTFMESPAGKTKKAMNNMQEALKKAFTPERIEKFANAMERVADFVELIVDNWEIFAGLIAAFKVGSLVSQVGAIADSMGDAAKGAAGMSDSLDGAAGKLSKLGGVLQAATAGFAVGTAIDQAFGISDAISDAALSGIEEKADSAFIRDRAADFGFRGRAQIAAQGGDLTRRQRLSARTFLASARERGIVGEGGEIDREAAFKAARAGATSPVQAQAQTDRFVQALEFALQQERKGAIFDVRVSVDPNSNTINAEETSESKARRSTS